MNDPATAPLQATLDEHTLKIAALAAATTPPHPNLRRATQLGCIPNDPAVDNAPLLQNAIDAGLALEIDGFYHTSPLRTKPGGANAIYGVSSAYRHSPACRTGFAPFASGQTHILEVTGDATAGAGLCQRIADLYFAGSATCDGIRVSGGDTVAIERCSFRGCKDAIDITPTIRLYSLAVRSCFMSTNDIGIRLTNGSSVCCFIADSCSINGGRIGVSVNWWQRGAVFTGVLCEGQTEVCFDVREARASLIGCYGESTGEIPALNLKQSHIVIIDSHFRRYKHDGLSQITAIGDNVLSGTLAY